MFVVKDAVREPLYAIVPYQNCWRWKSREKHTIRAIKHFMDAGAVVILVESAFNRREFTFADSGLDGTPASCGVMGTDHNFRHRYIGLRNTSELWLKENMIDVAVQMALPHDWQQLCFLDSDVHFLRPNWVGECIHKLQHYSFLQMFSHARDLGPNYEMLPQDYPHADGLGYVDAWQKGYITSSTPDKIDVTNHSSLVVNDELEGYYNAKVSKNDIAKRVFPGLAWACTRKAWDDVGGLLDIGIWGGGDWHMAHALIEKTESMMRNDLHRNYKKIVNQWYERCRTHIRQNVGVMEGTIVHHWHGKKTSRGYNAKHAILAKVGFDPLRHLKRDSQGIYQLHDDRSTAYVQIRDMMRRIAKERNEDSIDI